MAALWLVGSLSFVVALSGALMPGPLLTFTVALTVRTPRRGWLTGALVTAGHAALEGAIVIGLLLGVLEFLRTPVALKAIGTVGGAFLAWSGIAMLVGLLARRGAVAAPAAAAARGAGAGAPASAAASPFDRLGPVLGGALVSMANPYWWVWWVTVGAATMLRFDVSFERWPVLAAFFLGHEAGDLAWYLVVSTLVHLGRRGIPPVAYDVLLGVCAAAVIGFGAYLGVSAWFAA
jgi:threonine/homoserine/homoserine lactone efflux protein